MSKTFKGRPILSGNTQGEALGVVLGEERIEGPDLLDETAITRSGRFGDDDAIVRTLLGAATGQSDLQRHVVFQFFSFA